MSHKCVWRAFQPSPQPTHQKSFLSTLPAENCRPNIILLLSSRIPSPLHLLGRYEFELARTVFIKAHQWYVAPPVPQPWESPCQSAKCHQTLQSILTVHSNSFETKTIQCPIQTINNCIARLLFFIWGIRLRCFKQRRRRHLAAQSSTSIHDTSFTQTHTGR
jgi:hypothetical protein